MEPKVGERIFALSAPGAFNERLGRRRCQVPASAVDGENARLCSRAGHRCGLTAAVLTAGGAEIRGGVSSREGSAGGYFWPSPKWNSGWYGAVADGE